MGALIAIAIAIALDFTGSYWARHPMLAGVVSGVLLLLVTALLVEEVLVRESARRWKPVAEFAHEDLGRVARELWVNLTAPVAPLRFEAKLTAELRDEWLQPGGKERLRTALEGGLAGYRADVIRERTKEIGKRSVDVLARWAPLAPAEGMDPELISEFAQMHRTLVRTLRAQEVVRAGYPEAAPIDELDGLTDVTWKALEIDQRTLSELT